MVAVSMLCPLLPAPAAGADYVLWLDSVRAYPGENVDFNVNLTNLGPVGSFNLLVKYDPTAVWPVGLTSENTRSVDFEYFEYFYNEGNRPGEIRIMGISDIAGTPPPAVNPLSPGDGSLAKITFVVDNSIDLAGMYIPVRFVFHDAPINSDNTLTDDGGTKIEQSQIDYLDGYIAVREMGAVNVGDVNLNGFACEVSDYVYFSNYFTNPSGYPLNALQLANTDMNNDHIPATISDLVTLIGRIMDGTKTQVSSGRSFDRWAMVGIESFGATKLIGYESDFEVGGVLITLRTSEPVDPNTIRNLNRNMQIQTVSHDRETRIFVYSSQGETLAAGRHDLISLEGFFDAEIVEVDMADASGRTVMAAAPSSRPLPNDFVLHQNYPNPFNPSTEISFSLGAASVVRLSVYDLLGRSVKMLIDDYREAGRYGATWDGRDKNGRTVSSGVYFYRLETNYGEQTRKMIMMK